MQSAHLCYNGYLVSNGIMSREGLRKFFGRASSADGGLFFAYKVVLMEIWLRRVFLGEGHAESANIDKID
jgi:hypothetical protein